MQNKLTICVLLCAGVLATNAGIMGKQNIPASRQKWLKVALPDEHKVVHAIKTISPLPEAPASRVLGTYTGISGYFDYQVNAGACQYIRLDPSDPSGNLIHVIMMQSADSAAPTSDARGTYYIYSTNAGASWTTPLRVPTRRSGYPSLDLLQGSVPGTVIANHNDGGAGLSSFVYVDSPPGGGAFAELTAPGEPFGSDERSWPDVTGPSDGSVAISASRQTALTCFITRTADFSTWAPWSNLTPTGGAGLPMKSNSTGRVGCLHNTTFGADDGIYFFESTDDGATWPATGRLLFPNPRLAPPDTFGFTLGCDLVYKGDNVLVVAGETNNGLNAPTDSAQITFWSDATSFRVAASKVNTPGVSPSENRATFNTSTLDMPSIGLSGNAIVVAYQAMMDGDTSSNGYNCCDVFLVFSNDGGLTWSTPRNVSNSRGLDDRFVSVAPWNPPGIVDLVWQEDTQAGGNIITDPGATVSLVRQVFLRTTITGVEENGSQPASFALGQNYPNPFNPSTTIRYSVGAASHVTLKVFNTLGQEVATLVDENQGVGDHQAKFDAARLSSGVYVYRITAGSLTESKKMLLLK